MQKIAQISAGILVSTVMATSAAHAIIADITATVVTPGAYSGVTGTGTFEFDETQADGDYLADFGSLSLTLDFGNGAQTFTEADDAFFGPGYSLAGGLITDFDLFIDLGINDPDIIVISSVLGSVTSGGNPALVFDLDVETLKPIPLPATLPLALAGLGLIGFIGRKKA